MTREAIFKTSISIGTIGFVEVASRQLTGDADVGIVGYTVIYLTNFIIGPALGVIISAILAIAWIPALIIAYTHRDKNKK